MRKILLGLLFSLWTSLASAGVSCTLPFNLQNNTIADATQVMANYNALVTCLSNAAAAGANSDITALFGLTTPLTNAQLANMAAQTVKCNPTGTAGNAVPRDCNFQCIIDGTVFPSTLAGIQAAINIAACQDIYIPAGTYSGTAQLSIVRSTIRLHGASGIGDNAGSGIGASGSTLLNFTSCVGNSVLIGDASASHTWTGISLEDLSIVVPGSCTINVVDIRASAGAVANMFRRVRITTPGSSASTGVNLESNTFGWRFENVVVDHFGTGYNLAGSNHFTRIIGGQINNNTVGIQTTTSNSQNVTVDGVDIEGNTSYGLDIQGAQGFIVRDCFFDNNANANARAIRVGAGGTAPIGVTAVGSIFNGGTANYAIELASGGFSGLHIINNHFNSYVTSNVLNNSGTAGFHGAYFANDNFPTSGGAVTQEMSSGAGFDIFNFQLGAPGPGFSNVNLARPGVRGAQVLNVSFALGAGWGTTATATAATGARDTVGQVQITPGGTGIAANATATLTFQDGTWTAAPFCYVMNTGEGTVAAAGQTRTSGTTATTVSWVFEGTPNSGQAISFTWTCWAAN